MQSCSPRLELSLEACTHRACMCQGVGGSPTKTRRYCSPHLQPAAELLTFWCVVTHDGWYHHGLITTTCFIWNEPDVCNENTVMRETQSKGRHCAQLGVFYYKNWNKREDVDDEQCGDFPNVQMWLLGNYVWLSFLRIIAASYARTKSTDSVGLELHHVRTSTQV